MILAGICLMAALVFVLLVVLQWLFDWMADPYMDDWWRMPLGMTGALLIFGAGLLGIAMILMVTFP